MCSFCPKAPQSYLENNHDANAPPLGNSSATGFSPWNGDGPTDPIFLVTIADKSLLTTAQTQQINLSQIRRKLGAGLMGLAYIGMIEPGYCNVIYDEFCNQRKNVISWRGHFLVWGITEKQLAKHLAKIKPRFTPIVPGLCAVHKKLIPPDQFGYKRWYILKAPRKEYSIG
jgi:hypothetical protein